MRRVRALSERVDEHLRYLQSVGAHFGADASFLREQQAEITALRAALDQERADNELLRALVYDAFMEGWYRNAGYTDRRNADFGREWEQYSKTPAPTALLSGRGEGM